MAVETRDGSTVGGATGAVVGPAEHAGLEMSGYSAPSVDAERNFCYFVAQQKSQVPTQVEH